VKIACDLRSIRRDAGIALACWVIVLVRAAQERWPQLFQGIVDQRNLAIHHTEQKTEIEVGSSSRASNDLLALCFHVFERPNIAEFDVNADDALHCLGHDDNSLIEKNGFAALNTAHDEAFMLRDNTRQVNHGCDRMILQNLRRDHDAVLAGRFSRTPAEGTRPIAVN
jgi:hypothetical protein